ncbi:MAG: hypothetical protein KDD41_04375 [Flavobacteriales bacterium]|nr:hypothetical protein [Flavobacteriales bacterium]
MLRFTKISVVFLLVLVLFSCRKDFERANWDVDLLAPLIKTSLNLQDLLPDSVLQTNPDTSLKIVYEKNIFDVNVDSLFKIPDTTITEIYSIPLSSTVAPGDSFYSEAKEYSLNVSNGVGLNYAEIESGFIEVEIFSEIKEKVIVTYTIPSATKNGDTLVLKDIINAASPGVPAYYSKKIDMSGYVLDLTGISKAKINTLVTRAVGVVDTNATSSVTLTIGEKITFNNKLIDIVPYFVRGYFGQQQFSYSDTTQFNAFSHIASGSLDLEQVNVDLEFRNGIGVDAQLLMKQFGTANTNTSQNAMLSHSIMNTPININRSQLTGNIPEVNYTSYSINLNTNNSNIDQLIEIFPNQLLYDIDLTINPLGNISGYNDFVYKKHVLETNLKVEFPLSLIASSLTLQDTVDFSLPDQAETGRIIDGTLFLFANNGFPLDATISLNLYDENNGFLGTLPVNDYIKAAPVNSSLRVSSKRESVLSIPLSAATVDKLYEAKKIVLNIAFTTQPQSQFLKIYEEYAIDIQLVGDFQYNLSLK